MKINTMKLVVGVLAAASVASLAGSISGTFAWLQYNTRDRVEFQGATAQCSENLQVRIIYQDGENVAYGPWKEDLTNNDIMLAAKKNDASITANVSGDYPAKQFVPVTMPGINQSSPAGDIFGHPVCGYPEYAKWQKPLASDYMRFALQFRVLDVDGVEADAGKAEAEIAMPLYLTDITFHNTSGPTDTDITSALRVHATSGTQYKRLMSYDVANAASSVVTTATCGHLDLNNDGKLDDATDRPNKYSWDQEYDTDDNPIPLDYGGTASFQKWHNLASPDNEIYPVVKANGYIDQNENANQIVGTTKAVAHNGDVLADADYLTINFVVWLEGWQKFADDDMQGADKTIWDDNAAIGSTFDIGMSFAVSTLRDIA